MIDSERPTSYCSSNRSSVASHLSTWSWQTDEGYHSEDKPYIHAKANDDQAHERPHASNRDKPSERNIPIHKSTRNIRMSYTPVTYVLTTTILLLSSHMLAVLPRPWTYSFPPLFFAFQLLFHVAHLTAHLCQWAAFERHCLVYGVWLYWTGWLLGIFVFSEKLAVDVWHPTASMFWLLLLERRHAWGIIMWEFVSLLNPSIPSNADQPLPYWQTGQFRLIAYRVWCLLGAGSLWGLVYVAVAHMDGFSLLYLLRPISVAKLLAVSFVAGLSMICFWSFWTFQYRGILWRRELRQGVVVWYSDGMASAGDVE